MSEATKHDQGKPQLDLLPYSALAETAQVFMFGAKKYSRWNWRKGFVYSRLINSALRHINQFNDGCDLDDESGRSHIAHAACCVLMLLEHINKGLGTDDRYKKSSVD